MTARVTVIIPTYRRPAMLKLAIESVLRQSFEDFRVCVYDNASGDETESVVAAIATSDPRLTYYRHAENIGAFANFRYGMQHVQTPFFSFLSDDDVLYPGFLALGTRLLDQHPDAMLFAGSTLELAQDGKLLYAPVLRWPREGLYTPPEGARQMLGNKHPTWTSVLFRCEVIERIGPLDSEVGDPNDLDYELQVAAHFPIVISFAPCAAFIRHPSANSRREDTSVAAGYRRIAAKFARDESLSPHVRATMSSALRNQLRLKLVEISVKAVVRGDDAIARDALALLGQEGFTLVGSALQLTLPACMKAPVARSLLGAAEATRMRLRAWRAARLSATKRSLEDPISDK